MLAISMIGVAETMNLGMRLVKLFLVKYLALLGIIFKYKNANYSYLIILHFGVQSHQNDALVGSYMFLIG